MKSLLPILTCLIIAGCDEGGGRPCSTFDLPQAKYWTTVDNVGESATFTSASGKNLTMTLLSREDNEPFEGYDRFGSDEVVCDKYSRRRYEFGDDSAGLLIEFQQAEGFDVPLEAQYFSIRTLPEAPSGTALDYVFLTDPFRLDFYGETGILEDVRATYRVLRDVVFGSVQYDLALEEVYRDTSNIVVPEGVEKVSGLVFAQGNDEVRGGLVRIDFANGESYTRVN